MPAEDRATRKQLLEFVRGGHAHASFDDTVKGFPSQLYAEKPEGAPHNAWQLLEHIRITLHDLLEFCTNPEYEAPKWPDEYWPGAEAPESSKAWNDSIEGVREDLAAFEQLIQNTDVDLYAKIPWGEGQNILREILLAIDHTSYHLGQMVMLRKQLDAWKK